MPKTKQQILRDIVLVGGGHTHVEVLRRFGMKPVPGVRLTLICRDAHTPYSGMLPGYIAGHYDHDEVHIDLARLARFAGARFYPSEVMGLDRSAQKVLCPDRAPVAYDLVSMNIGSTPQLQRVPGAADNAVPVKPIDGFDARWRAIVARVRKHPGRIRIAVVGAGAGGVELILAMQYRLRNELRAAGRDPDALELHLFNADAQILATHNAGVRSRFQATLARRGIAVHNNTPVTEVDGKRLVAGNGQALDADEIIWVTQAGGAGWLSETGLALTDDGFIRVRDTLQSVTDSKVFAAGDIATMDNHSRPKSGVFAVRQGPPLTENLRRMIKDHAPNPFHPQAGWLALVSTGDKHAVASRGPFWFAGDWVWRLKDHIDRRFMRKYNDLPTQKKASP